MVGAHAVLELLGWEDVFASAFRVRETKAYVTTPVWMTQ